MRLEYDEDAAYVYIQFPIKAGEAEKTLELNENIMLDFDSKGKLLGVEILDASKILRKEVLKEAIVKCSINPPT